MVFRQLTHDDLGCASYLIGDEAAGVAAVVDPRLDVEEYLRVADYLGVRVEHVLETHTHADHVSGHGRLAAATGATIHVHEEAAASYEHEPFADGWELRLGSLLVRALHTPGHRPEHTAFALVDTARSEDPWAVLTGDSLFVGDVARPDLAVDADEGARGLFRSLHERLLSLPPTTEVWPGHLGGSMCGGPGMDLKPASTIGFEREAQPLLQVGDEDEFVRRATATLGAQPPNFRAIVALNRGPLVTHAPASRPLTPAELRRAQGGGALVVDVRDDAAFDGGHVPGAVGVTTARPGFGTKLGWLAPPGRPLVFVGDGDEDAVRAARLAAAVGLRDVAGHLGGGMASWEAERRPVDRLRRMTVAELHEEWRDARRRPQVLDVRARPEWDAGHIPGSLHAPYQDLQELPDGLDPSRTVAVVCASGQRAAVAAGVLQQLGARDVVHVTGGGVPLWQRSGWPVARGPAAG